MQNKHNSGPRAPRRVSLIVGAAVLLAAALGAVVYAMRPAHATDAAASAQAVPLFVRNGDKLSVPDNSPLRKRLAVAAVGDAKSAHVVALPAVVEADAARTVNILPPVTGRLTELRVKLGDVVKQGQILAVVNSPDLAQALADADKAKDALELARKALERARSVNEAGANAAKDMELAESNHVQAQAEWRRAESRLNALGGSAVGADKSRALNIVAPLSGTVTALNNAHGAYLADPNAALMTIANLDQVWVTANVPENLIAAVAKGQSAEVSLAAYPGLKLQGTVSVVSAVMEADTRRNKTRIAFANADGKLKPNMFATVQLAVAQTGPAGKSGQAAPVAVPTSALLMNNDSTTVFVEVQPWTFVRRVVELGSEDGDTVRIVSGLAPGERVVTRGGVLLND